MTVRKGSGGAGPPADRILAQLEKWRCDLDNLNRSNGLLYFRPAILLEIVEPPSRKVYAGLDRVWRIADRPDRGPAPARPRRRSRGARSARWRRGG